MNLIYLFNNPILNTSSFDFNSTLKIQIYFSSYNSILLNDSINQFKEIYVFDDDLKNINLSNIYNQKQLSKSIQSIKYYKSANLITLANMFRSDCLRTLDFMKQRVHFNLFLHQQIDNFFSQCRKFQFEFN